MLIMPLQSSGHGANSHDVTPHLNPSSFCFSDLLSFLPLDESSLQDVLLFLKKQGFPSTRDRIELFRVEKSFYSSSCRLFPLSSSLLPSTNCSISALIAIVRSKKRFFLPKKEECDSRELLVRMMVSLQPMRWLTPRLEISLARVQLCARLGIPLHCVSGKSASKPQFYCSQSSSQHSL